MTATSLYFGESSTWGYRQPNNATGQQTVQRQQIPPANTPHQPPNFAFQQHSHQHTVSRGQFKHQNGSFSPNGSQQTGDYLFPIFTPPNMTARPPHQNQCFSPNGSQSTDERSFLPPSGSPFPNFIPPNMVGYPPQNGPQQPGGYHTLPPQGYFSPPCTPPTGSRSTTPITVTLALPPSIDDLNQLILTIAQQQGLEAARKFFDTFPNGMKHNLTSYYNMLTVYIDNEKGSYKEIDSLFNQMRKERINTDAFFYLALVPACKKTGRREIAIHLARKIRDDRVTPDIVTANTMLQMLGEMRCDKEAYNVFERLNNRNANTFEIMYTMNISVGCVQKINTVNQFRRTQKIPATKTMVQALAKNADQLAKLYQEEKGSGLLTEHLCHQMWESCVERENGQGMIDVIHDMQDNKLPIPSDWFDKAVELFSKNGNFDLLEETITAMHTEKIAIDCETLLTTYLTHKNLARYIEFVKKLIAMGMPSPTFIITRTCYNEYFTSYQIAELLDFFSQLKGIGINFENSPMTNISMRLRSGIETLSRTSLKECSALFEKACKLEFPISKHVLAAYFIVLKNNNQIDELNRLHDAFKNLVKYDRVIRNIVKFANDDTGNVNDTNAKTKRRR